MFRRQFILGSGALVPGLVGSARYRSGSLAQLAASRGVLFGTELAFDEISTDPDYAALIATECAIVTPGIEAKWRSVQPSEGNFHFGPLDSIVNFASRNGLAVHMHNLVWAVGLPDWVLRALAAGRGREVLRDHIAVVAARYADRVESWDVVNEPVDPRWPSAPNGLCTTPWWHGVGDNYVTLAIREARMADARACLLINDDDLEYALPGAEKKRSAYLRLIESWLAAGVPLGGFGLEAHLKPWLPISDRVYREFLRSLAAFGLRLYVTEMDICDRSLLADIPTRDRLVAELAKRYLDIVLDETSVCAVIMWGLSDRHSNMKRDPASRRQDGLPSRPSPFDDHLQPKPMYQALASAFHAAPNRRESLRP